MKDDTEALQDEMENNCLTSLYLVSNLTILLSAAIYYQYYNMFYQAVDRAKNTPLHIIVSYKKIVSDFLTLHAIIMALLESGEVQLLVVAHH